ncbi:uncharacterized protein [Clytia hemisphaerica]|uniref:uncharacterized protein isoform X3 n=1 Tax=Clytia hemisphaerica TaxID=252671 RepID=UPI0034D593F5
MNSSWNTQFLMAAVLIGLVMAEVRTDETEALPMYLLSQQLYLKKSNDEMSKRSELPVGLINVKHFGKENGYAKKDIPMRFLSKKDIPMRFLSKKDIPMRFLSKRENEEDIPMRFLSKRGELPMRFLAKKDDEKNSEEEKRSQEKLCKRVVDICSNVLDQKR